MVGWKRFVVDRERLAKFALGSSEIALVVQENGQTHARIANLVVLGAVEREPNRNGIAQQRLRLGQTSLALQEQAVVALGDRGLGMMLAVGEFLALQSNPDTASRPQSVPPLFCATIARFCRRNATLG